MKERAVIGSRAGRRAGLVVGMAMVVAPLLGCGGSGGQDPESVLRNYARALDEGRADDAYRMLSDEARRGTSLEAFRRSIKDDPAEVHDIAQALARPTSRPVVTATITTAKGQDLLLILEKGLWKVDATAIDLYPQDTPRHAIAGFLRAVKRQRYDIVLKYVPDARRDGLDAAKLKAAWEGPDREEIQQVTSAIERVLPTANIEEVGDHATLPYDNATVQLVRERGLWKIEDFD